jgi:hypothetical protein
MTLKEWLTDSSTGNNPTLQTVAGMVYLEIGELEEAAKVLHSGTTLEMVSLQVQVKREGLCNHARSSSRSLALAVICPPPNPLSLSLSR